MNKVQFDQLLDDVKEIKLAVVGDTSLGIEGLVKSVKRHDNWINQMNLKVAAWSGGSTAVVMITGWVIQHLLK